LKVDTLPRWFSQNHFQIWTFGFREDFRKNLHHRSNNDGCHGNNSHDPLALVQVSLTMKYFYFLVDIQCNENVFFWFNYVLRVYPYYKQSLLCQDRWSPKRGLIHLLINILTAVYDKSLRTSFAVCKYIKLNAKNILLS
jgi:hypothetical protein